MTCVDGPAGSFSTRRRLDLLLSKRILVRNGRVIPHHSYYDVFTINARITSIKLNDSVIADQETRVNFTSIAQAGAERNLRSGRQRVAMNVIQPETRMDPNPLPLVIRALERAALQSTVLPYKRFHVLFERTVPLTRRYEVLDAALRELNDGPDIDYGVLLACDNGLPGPDFFRRYQKYRWDKYVAAMGDPRFKSATLKGKRELVAAERAKVHLHALHARHQERDRECA